MGCLLSCCKKRGASPRGTSNGTKETEMSSNASKSLSVSRSMTAPTIEVTNGTQLSGMGLALVGTTVEQDAAYVSSVLVCVCAGMQPVTRRGCDRLTQNLPRCSLCCLSMTLHTVGMSH